MKKTVLVIVALLTFWSTQAQVIPNNDFENWTTYTLFEAPDEWDNSNDLFFSVTGSETILKSTDSQEGMFSCRLESVSTLNGDSTFGFVLLGIPPDTGLNFDGGFPITGTPDSLKTWMKYDIQAGDTGFVIVALKASGVTVSFGLYPITGTQNTWTEMSFPIPAPLSTPDTAVIGVVSSNAFAEFSIPGSWVMVDDMRLTGVADIIPNGDFEMWHDVSIEDPDDWTTTNGFTAAAQANPAVTPSMDANSGMLAMSIETQVVPNFDGGFDTTGFASTGVLNQFGLVGGFPIPETPTAISGYYKYNPVGADTGSLILLLTQYNSILDSTFVVGLAQVDFTAASNYTYFEQGVFLFPGSFPDTANIIVSASQLFDGSGVAGPGSELLIDDLNLIFPNSAPNAVMDAASSQNGSTIVVDVQANDNDPDGDNLTTSIVGGPSMGMAVVLNGDSIEYSPTGTPSGFDTIWYSICDNATQPLCDTSFISIENIPSSIQDLTDAEVNIFPNPVSEILNLHFMELGTYEDIKVFDPTGRLVYTSTLAETQNIYTIDVSNWAEGVYRVLLGGPVRQGQTSISVH